MLKFFGKVVDFKDFMKKLTEDYGEKTTIKEVIKMIGALKNVNM